MSRPTTPHPSAHPSAHPVRRRTALAVLAATGAALALSACGGGAVGASSPGSVGPTDVSSRVSVQPDATAVALLPAAVKARGTLVVGAGFGAGSAPLGYYAADDKTVVGIEPDIAALLAAKLGLEPEIQVTSWENLFIGLDSGKYDVGISNITDTEKRKQKYDFATYRRDNVTFEAKAGTTWRVRSGKDIAGKTIAVGSGTNQEKILLDWNTANVKAGLPAATVKYYQNASDTYLALASGRIDGYFAPNPSVAYHVASVHQTEAIGTFSGAGAGLQGLIAATTKKGNGLVAASAAALNSAIADGSYAKTLAKWNLSDEAVTTSQVNPPGLPITD